MRMHEQHAVVTPVACIDDFVSRTGPNFKSLANRLAFRDVQRRHVRNQISFSEHMSASQVGRTSVRRVAALDALR